MTGTLNYREFYQKQPIVISERDLTAFQQEVKFAGDFTHWLIALEGVENRLKDFQWRVVVFPSSEGGNFNCKLPFFQSPFIRTFNEACELLTKIEALARQDQLFTLHQ